MNWKFHNIKQQKFFKKKVEEKNLDAGVILYLFFFFF